MEISNVILSQEVYRSDAEKICQWLSDKELTSYLNEEANVQKNIMNTINRLSMPILTHLFNNNCRFFIIKNLYGSIGFLRLVPKGKNVEIVIAVGEKELWGKGIGHNSVLEALKVAFFDMRSEYVVAKIKKSNVRSQNLFKGLGFKKVKELAVEIQYEINIRTFIGIAA